MRTELCYYWLTRYQIDTVGLKHGCFNGQNKDLLVQAVYGHVRLEVSDLFMGSMVRQQRTAGAHRSPTLLGL